MSDCYPTAQTLREQAAQIERDAPSIADSSEYPRVAKFTCAGQVEAVDEPGRNDSGHAEEAGSSRTARYTARQRAQSK